MGLASCEAAAHGSAGRPAGRSQGCSKSPWSRWSRSRDSSPLLRPSLVPRSRLKGPRRAPSGAPHRHSGQGAGWDVACSLPGSGPGWQRRALRSQPGAGSSGDLVRRESPAERRRRSGEGVESPLRALGASSPAAVLLLQGLGPSRLGAGRDQHWPKY